MLQMNSGMRADLRRVIVASARFWAAQLAGLQVVDETSSGLLNFSEHVGRDDIESDLPMVIHGIAGEPMHVEMRCFDFDPHRQVLIDAEPNTGFDGLANLEIRVHKDYTVAPSSLELPR
ncbi:hypothetical protein [Bowmanella dokdonensis]